MRLETGTGGIAGSVFDEHERLPLGCWPTPLTPLPRLSAAVGGEIWIKRDDYGSLGLAGNKVRKLELELARATEVGADAVVTVGAQQSNMARATAAAGARIGLEVHLVLPGPAPARSDGNLLLDRLFGATVHFVDDNRWQALDQAASEVTSWLEANGRRPYSIPLGASSPLGALGFAAAYLEADHQLNEAGIQPAAIVHASTSGGTHAGLLLGRALRGGGPALKAIGVATGIHPDEGAHIAELAGDAAALVGSSCTFAAAEIELDHGWIGAGYGEPTPACLEAIGMLARTEAIVCDPVYSGKALAAAVALAAGSPEPVLFWHTGGFHCIFTPRYASQVLISHQAACTAGGM